MNSMQYKCIIFDCDGVLVDSEATSIAVLVGMAADIGLELDLDTAIRAYSGHSLAYCLEDIERQAAQPLAANKVDLFRERTFRAFRQDLKAIPGVEQVIKQIKCPICVASNAPKDKIQLNLNLLNLNHYFDGHYFSAYDLQKWKPEPDLFLHAAQQMGIAVKDCAVIEDSLAGVQAAVRGGFDVYAYTNISSAAILKKAGAKVFYSMSDLIPLLQ